MASVLFDHREASPTVALAAIFSAEEAELRRVPGIGPVRGAELARLFHATFARG